MLKNDIIYRNMCLHLIDFIAHLHFFAHIIDIMHLIKNVVKLSFFLIPAKVTISRSTMPSIFALVRII